MFKMATEVRERISRWQQESRLNLLSQNGRYIGESSEQWKSRLESKWDSIIHRFSRRLAETACVIEVFKDEFISIISRDNWEVFLYLTSYLLGLEYNIDDTVIWSWISKHDAIKIADVIMIKDLPITLKSTQPFPFYSAASNHSFKVVEFFLSTSLYGGSQVETCLDIALTSAWATLEDLTSDVCWKKSPEEAINCFKLIATLCLPQMKPALSTLDRFACFMSDELLAKEACNRAKQGRFLDYALLLMVAPRKVLDFTDRRSFLDGLRSEMSSEWPVVYQTCISLFDIFSAVYYDFYELWQSSEGLTQQEIVHRVYRICRRAGLYVRYKDFKLRDPHTLCPQPKHSVFVSPSAFLRIPDIRTNIYPKGFEDKLIQTSYPLRRPSTSE